ncbi:MAG: tryptophanase, partial [Deltaproteobacteria bacterium]
IKTVRRAPFSTVTQRRRWLADLDFNVLSLTPEQITFDMVSKGTSAFSQDQQAALYLGDEAYAGAVNFEHLQQAVSDILGKPHVVPAHNLLGAIKLVVATMVADGEQVPANTLGLRDALAPRGVRSPDVRSGRDDVFTGNLDLAALERQLEQGDVALVHVDLFADAQHPVSLGNLQQVRRLCDGYGVRLCIDGSRIVEAAWMIRRHEPGRSTGDIATLVRRLADLATVVMVDGAQDPRSNTGALLATTDPRDHEILMNEVVVYEGLHTYGGMAGRTMEVLARGLVEMVDDARTDWIMHQAERFTARLRQAGVPLERGCDGAYLLVDEFLPHIAEHAKDALSAALYLQSGIRAVNPGMRDRDRLVPVQIPRLAMTNHQLDQVADAIAALYRQRGRIAPLQAVADSRWRDQVRYRWTFPDLEPFELTGSPFLIHTFEPIGALSPQARREAIEEAGYNTFLLRSADVTIDFLTDSGTAAMSTEQWAAYEAAIPTIGESTAHRELVAELQDLFGYRHVLPTHQGRAAEHILSQICIQPGQFVPGNMYFTTTKLHQELAGGIFADVIVDEAHDPQSDYPWKGDIDLDKLRRLVDEHGAARIAYVSFEHSVNMAGGQPVSMDNMRQVYTFCARHGIKVFFDSTRVAENAEMIRRRDPRYHDVPIRDIIREMMMYGDGCTVSGKKDFLINIGGVLAFRDDATLAAKAEEMLRVYEGAVSDGGLPVADLATIAQGVREMQDDRYIRHRVQQTRDLGAMLLERGIPIVTPPGSHAIFIDARRFLPHLDQDEYPAQRLAAEIYVETGVRAMERGNVSKGRDPTTGENYRPSLELVRLTIPRRVYTHDHLRAVADGIARVWRRRDRITGLRFTYEPRRLRFFQGRFEPVA